MKVRAIIFVLIFVLCSGNYDDKQNYGEYVPKIFMGSSGK